MKKIITMLCMLVCVCMMSACMRGKTNEVKIYAVDSGIYSEQDISNACQTVRSYFEREYGGCSMTELYYIGDAENPSYAEFAGRIGADEVIVLVSEYRVSDKPSDPSLMPGSTCSGGNWILGRKKGGDWKLIDQGY